MKTKIFSIYFLKQSTNNFVKNGKKFQLKELVGKFIPPYDNKSIVFVSSNFHIFATIFGKRK